MAQQPTKDGSRSGRRPRLSLDDWTAAGLLVSLDDVAALPNASLHVWYEEGVSAELYDALHAADRDPDVGVTVIRRTSVSDNAGDHCNCKQQ